MSCGRGSGWRLPHGERPPADAGGRVQGRTAWRPGKWLCALPGFSAPGDRRFAAGRLKERFEVAGQNYSSWSVFRRHDGRCTNDDGSG